MTFELVNGTILESGADLANMQTTAFNGCGGTSAGGSYSCQITPGYYQQSSYYPYWQPTYWYSYPVYVCSDKTKKAIEVLKALQAEKLLKCDSVSRFIELVEKIAGLL